MHSLIHIDYAKASARRDQRPRAVSRGPEPPPGPPKRVRPAVARVLAIAASRVDREVARRVVA